MRSGARVLTLLADPLNCLILQSLSQGAKRQVELRREADSPAQSTLRTHLGDLEAIEAIVKRRRNAFPGVLEYELQPPGRELRLVAATLERWLATAPDGPLALSSGGAKAAIKALAEGWSTSILRALAARPLSLTELDCVIGSLSYPSLERRLSSMRLAGQIEPLPANGRGTPYAVTKWLRQAVAPLVAATRWERRHVPSQTAPIGRLDTEGVLLLAVPLVRLPGATSGTCRMAVEISNGSARRLAGVMVDVKDGEVASCTSRLQGSPEAWASGSVSAWLSAVIEADVAAIELGGDGRLAHALLAGLHGSLFRAEVHA